MTTNYPDYPSGATAATPGGENGGSDSGAKERARQVAGTAAEETRRVSGVAQQEASRVASEASSQVQGLLGEVTVQVEEQSRVQLDRLAERLRSVGEDLERMATQGEGPASGLAQEAGERVRSWAAHLRGREPRDLLDEVRGFARRRPGVFLGGALVAGVVAGRLTRGAKAARSDGPSSSGHAPAVSVYDAPVAADVTSPGQPLSSGYAAPSSGPIADPSTQGHGTASGDPLAGVGLPDSEPVYPGGGEAGRA